MSKRKNNKLKKPAGTIVEHTSRGWKGWKIAIGDMNFYRETKEEAEKLLKEETECNT
jgi:hypothetical protein